MIGPFAASHIDAARALWGRTPGIGLSDSDGPEQLARFLGANPQTCFVLLWRGALAGTVLGGSDGRRGYIYHLAVDGSLRGLGYGKVLLDACLEGLLRVGIPKVHLFVKGDNEQVLSFYPHLGWARRDDLVVFSKGLVECPGTGGCTC